MSGKRPTGDISTPHTETPNSKKALDDGNGMLFALTDHGRASGTKQKTSAAVTVTCPIGLLPLLVFGALFC
jgi:hypothetical protein